jgi:hypothetical protein
MGNDTIMLNNFSNGVFALGIFFGYIMALLSVLGFLYFDLSLKEPVFQAVFGVLAGGLITLSISIWVRTNELHDRYESLATVLQIRLSGELFFLSMMGKSFGIARENFKKNKVFDPSFSMAFLFEFFPVPEAVEQKPIELSELAFLIDILEGADNSRDLKTCCFKTRL